jgi:hypothetical protein
MCCQFLLVPGTQMGLEDVKIVTVWFLTLKCSQINRLNRQFLLTDVSQVRIQHPKPLFPKGDAQRVQWPR